jgi:voltage-gated potassium channel
MVLTVIPGVEHDAVVVVPWINGFLTLIFLFDFGLRLLMAPSRSFYFFHDYGWANLLAITPALRILRLFRIVKAYRLVRKYGLSNLLSYISVNRAESALYILVFAVIIIIQLGSFFVLVVEGSVPNANIKTATDAMWWTYVTITTVGYGDHYPVTDAGRLVGMIVMTTGVGIFATFAGYIANKLIVPSGKEKVKKERQEPGLPPATVTLAELKEYLEQREKIDLEISTRLSRLEQLLHNENTPTDATPCA